ncbi:protein of unknown function [Paraburkholderia kururiensis]
MPSAEAPPHLRRRFLPAPVAALCVDGLLALLNRLSPLFGPKGAGLARRQYVRVINLKGIQRGTLYRPEGQAVPP